MVKQLGILLISLFMFGACSSYEIREDMLRNRLCHHSWKISTFIDNTINEVVDVPNVNYKFNKNGTLIKTYEDGSTYSANWSFSCKAEYLIIGNNTFKIKTLSSKVLAVNYGDVEVFFVPVN